MTMRLSRIPLFLYLIFKQKLAEAFPRSSEDHAASNFLIHKGSKRKVLAFLKRSGAKDVLFLRSETWVDESENGAEKEVNSFQANGKGF
jgi:hypothetical protein